MKRKPNESFIEEVSEELNQNQVNLMQERPIITIYDGLEWKHQSFLRRKSFLEECANFPQQRHSTSSLPEKHP